MRALLDTGVWFRRYHRLPMSRVLRQYLDSVTEFYISPLSVAEICYKWSRGKLPQVPDPASWVPESLKTSSCSTCHRKPHCKPDDGLGLTVIWSIVV